MTTVRLANLAAAFQEEQGQIPAGWLGLEPAFRELVLLNTKDQEWVGTSRLW